MSITAAVSRDPVKIMRGAAFITIGMAIAWIVIVHVGETRDLVRTGVTTVGTVTKLSAGPSHPQIEFEDTAGSNIVFSGNGFVSHRVGERVGVIYRAREPQASAVLDEPGALWFFDVSMALLGLAFIVAGAFSIYRSEAQT